MDLSLPTKKSVIKDNNKYFRMLPIYLKRKQKPSGNISENNAVSVHTSSLVMENKSHITSQKSLLS